MALVTKEDLRFLGTGPIPIHPYVSQDYFHLEKDNIFKRCWHFVAREEEFRAVGDYLVQPFEMLNSSVLLVKGKEGRIGAFHNVCSHRGVKLVWDERGSARHFQCRYHGWGYDLDGQLRAVPDMDGFYELDKATCALKSVNVESWNGFIFVNFETTPTQKLTEYLGPMTDRMSSHPYGEFDSCSVIQAEVEVNWKCLLDNFQESYHLAFVHKLSLADKSTGPKNPFGKPISYEFLDPHRYMEVWGNYEHKPAPAEAIAGKYGAVLSQGAIQQKEGHKAIRSPNWAQDTYVIFPNLIMGHRGNEWVKVDHFSIKSAAASRSVPSAEGIPRPASHRRDAA